MTTAAEYIDLIVNLSDEEAEGLAEKAKVVGLDPQIYLKVRMLGAGELPDPAAFFLLFRRLTAFANEYEACLQSFAALQPDAMKQIPRLGSQFAQLVQEWDALRGPRP